MKGDLSFYSFKGTQKITTRPFRKDGCSNFRQFELRRLDEINRHHSMLNQYQPRRKKSLGVLVHSKAQMQLMTFLNVPDLPKLKISTSRKKLLDSKTARCIIVECSPLQKILNSKKKFTKKYFRSLKKFDNEQGIEKVRHVFEAVQVGNWSVVGYLKGNQIIFKAKHPKGKEKYLKYLYSKYISEIKTNYQEFVREKMELKLPE